MVDSLLMCQLLTSRPGQRWAVAVLVEPSWAGVFVTRTGLCSHAQSPVERLPIPCLARIRTASAQRFTGFPIPITIEVAVALSQQLLSTGIAADLAAGESWACRCRGWALRGFGRW